MSEKDIRDMKKLDELAEKAGGYVAVPNQLNKSRKFDEDFSTMRRYCVKNKISFSSLTENDYEKMGIRPF